MMNEMKLLLLIHAAITCVLIGLILTIQVVHYPLFAFVGAETYTAYQVAHMNAITCLVGPIMLAELVTAVLLALAPPPGVPPLLLWFGLGLVGVVWLLTLFVNTPQHVALSGGFDAATHAALVASSWARTLAWLLRGGVVLWALGIVLFSGNAA